MAGAVLFVDGVLEPLARLELRLLGGLDLHRRASLGVAASAARGMMMAIFLSDPAVVSTAIFVAWTALGTAVFIAVGDR